MNRTLLYTVQRVLEKLDLDVINSINDSQDAILVAREAEDTYYDLINRNEWPERFDLTVVESVGDVTNPTALRLPDNVLNISSVRYDITSLTDTDTIYKELIKLDTEDFLDRIYTRNSTDTDIVTASYKGIELYVYNSQAPEYYTTFDNEYLVLDSFDSEVETTVQGAKSVVQASSIPTFQFTDDYIIPLEATTYPLYLSEVTAAASMYLNGTQSPEDERRRNRGISRLRQSAFRTEVESKNNKFGRNGTGRS